MNYYVSQILKNKTITSYLEEKGIYPQKRSGDKDFYLCPIHKGDTAPSFVVYPSGYKERDYQTYYCYGCHSGITLINLKSDLENISTKASVKYFIKDIKIDSEDIIRSIIDDAKKNNLGVEEDRSIEFLLLLINMACRRHVIDDCKGDEEEKAFFEKFLKKVDDVARAGDKDLLEKISVLLDKGKYKRSENYKKKVEENSISSINWKL